MNRYILTGAPGAGKTTLVRRLAELGFVTVSEAATDVNLELIARGSAHPHLEPDFIDRIVALQRERRFAAEGEGRAQVHDRSVVCTLALCRHLGLEVPRALTEDLEEIESQDWFEPTVLFVAHLGFIEQTPVRRISFEHALAFEQIHREVYAERGYRLEEVPAGSIDDRIAQVRDVLGDT